MRSFRCWYLLLLTLLSACADKPEKAAARPEATATSVAGSPALTAPSPTYRGLVALPANRAVDTADPNGPLGVVRRFYTWYFDSVYLPLERADYANGVVFSPVVQARPNGRYALDGTAYLKLLRRLPYFTPALIRREAAKVAACAAAMSNRRYAEESEALYGNEACGFMLYHEWTRDQGEGYQFIRIVDLRPEADSAAVVSFYPLLNRVEPSPSSADIQPLGVRVRRSDENGWRIDGMMEPK